MALTLTLPNVLLVLNSDGTLDAVIGGSSALAYGFAANTSAGILLDQTGASDRLVFGLGTNVGVDVDGTHILGGGQLFTSTGGASAPALHIGPVGGTNMGIARTGASDYSLVHSTNIMLEIEASRLVLHDDLEAIDGTINLGTTSQGFNIGHFNQVRTTQLNLSVAGNSNLLMLLDRTTPSGATASGIEGFAGFKNMAIYTGNNSVANAQNTADVLDETGNITNAGASGNTGSSIFTPGTNAGSGLVGHRQIKSKLVVTTGGIVPDKVTGDPCGDTDQFPEGSEFYNDTSKYYCFCDGTNDVQMHDPATACF